VTQNLHPNRIVVLGAGEMASGVIYYLIKSGYGVVALEQENPVCVRRNVCFANAYYENKVEVEGVVSVLAPNISQACDLSERGKVALLIDPEGRFIDSLSPQFIIDGRMLKGKISPSRKSFPSVDKTSPLIGIGPGFMAGENCFAVIETNRGEQLGNVILKGKAQDYTGVPAAVNSITCDRVLRSPSVGHFKSTYNIADFVNRGCVIGTVNNIDVVSQIDGIIRGLIHENVEVCENQKIGDIDPRGQRELCYKISDKAHAIGQGVISAIRALNP
jgi:xanthine dehydrogenase accessory factor